MHDHRDDETGPQVHVYTVRFDFQWFIISTQGIADYDPNPQGLDFDYRAYQTWLNYETGEIRFLYDKVRTDAAGAEIPVLGAGARFYFGRKLRLLDRDEYLALVATIVHPDRLDPPPHREANAAPGRRNRRLVDGACEMPKFENYGDCQQP